MTALVEVLRKDKTDPEILNLALEALTVITTPETKVCLSRVAADNLPVRPVHFRPFLSQDGEPPEDDVGVMFTEIFVKDHVGILAQIAAQLQPLELTRFPCRATSTCSCHCCKSMITGSL